MVVVTVLLTILHFVICAFLILVVLLQRGRNQDLASAFGGGQTQANLAAMSTDDFLTRATKITAFLFMGTSLALALFSQTKARSVLDSVATKPKIEVAAPPTTGASGAAAPTTPELTPVPAPVEPAPSEPAPSTGESTPTGSTGESTPPGQ